MEKVVELIEKTMKANSLSNADLAKTFGVSPSAVSKLLNNHTEISFTSFIAFAQAYCSDNLTEVLITYCDSIEKNKENLRLCMEYASVHSDYSLFEYLLEREMDSSYDLNREWARIYKLVYKRQRHKLKPDEVINQARNQKCSSIEMKAMCQLLETIGYYEKDSYKTMFEISRTLEHTISKIKNNFIKNMYLSRIGLIYAFGYLRYKNDIDKTRKYVFYTINNQHLGIRYKAAAYHTLALSYFFEDYDKSLENLQIARQIYTQEKDLYSKGQLELNIQFLNNIWNKHDNFPFSDYNEKIHHLVRIGDTTKAKEMLSNINEETPFTKFYKAFTIEDEDKAIECLYESLEMFVNRGDRFYAENLVAHELIKRNEKPIVLRVACTI